MKKAIILFVCCQLFLSCEQISKSIDETLKSNDTLVTNKNVNPVSPPVVNTQMDVEKIIKTALETHSVTYTEQHTEGKNIDFLTDINALENAEEALRKLPQYAGKEIFIYSTLYFYNDGLINVMLQHPTNPKYVDIYTYQNGKWSEPKPLQLSVRDDVGKRLVSLNKIKFVNVAKVTTIYNKKAAEVEGAKTLTNAYVSIWDNKMRWYPTNINGSRERYSIQFNDDGTLKSFHQD
ncbi:hypothetical protein KHA90_14415 [Flavobacterium psychroterrae]|uniref:Lipoprotein n=1 Tax=Flavobacterium psychroterrae TaxID=2133767 RepID=A0ABS5PD56_9FLAO|nr:hypothetical protein [Flavobacterium psychroterrae]MBS7232217.1 hypothetical protein [Flavobacterium psychroterrae]